MKKFEYVYIQKGFTLLELVLSVTLIAVLLSAVILKFNPITNRKKAFDVQRLSNIAEIERVINESFLDTGGYPGQPNVLYSSNSINWIPVTNLEKYITVLPKDPGDKVYYYMQDGKSYEINASLEYFTDLMQKDEGNNDSRYEVGNNLFILNN